MTELSLLRSKTLESQTNSGLKIYDKIRIKTFNFDYKTKSFQLSNR